MSLADELRELPWAKHPDRDGSIIRRAADELQSLAYRLQAAEKERDRAVARAERLADLNPERDENDAEFEEATKEIEQLNVTNIRHENTIAELQSRLDSAAELIANAVANHDGGGKCELDASSAAVWLRDVERQEIES